MRRLVAPLLAVAIATHLATTSATLRAADGPIARPNIVLIFADDLGYGDVGAFGARDIKTPNIDRLAAEGTRFTSFYVAQPVCTASRAALMTGCYANRVGLFGALNHESKIGIAADELLLPEMLKERGYATAIFGKWHLGGQPYSQPQNKGFDEFYGIPPAVTWDAFLMIPQGRQTKALDIPLDKGPAIGGARRGGPRKGTTRMPQTPSR